MNLSKHQLWERFQKYYTQFPTLGLALDLSRMNFQDNFFSSMDPRMQTAFRAMAELEKGAIANPDENRMVGHYWLRTPALAPAPEIRREIEETIAEIKVFASQIHSGKIHGAKGAFKNLLLIGIGGSALGPQFVSHALGHPLKDKLHLFTFDNTDPDGMDRVLAQIGIDLNNTLCLVISKSGGTKETRNGMLEAKTAYERAALDFGRHAVAITQAGSELDKYATQQNWIKRFPMWDWVGGRTSELSAVGLLPAALEGFDIDSLLAGAHACDGVTRINNVTANPAAQLALAWFHSGNGKGSRNMVVIPYKDRLELFSKYLQQLIMESLGKEKDLDGNTVTQGICVFGNKGSTDQHSYIQQLRDGINNFFVTFVEVLQEREVPSIEVEPHIAAGDYLNGFLLGTRQALYENDRESLTLTIANVSPFSVGVLIALFERAVGFYASLVNINAYHQPGVEAGKKAASTVINLELEILQFFCHKRAVALTAAAISRAIDRPDDIETTFKICEHLAANPYRGIVKTPGKSAFEATYTLV
jgi:glucose-6-phosphate isomerase